MHTKQNNNDESMNICPYASECPVLQSAIMIFDSIISKLKELQREEGLKRIPEKSNKYISRKRCKFNSDFLCQLRRKYKLTLEDMSLLLGVNTLTVRNWENAKSMPPIKLREKISMLDRIGVRKIKKLLLTQIKQKNPQVIKI